MRTNRSYRNVLWAGVLTVSALALSAEAGAQFPGDVYFVKPSVSVKAGETARLDLQTFLGTASFGASQIDIEFTAGELDVVSVVPVAGYADIYETVLAPGKISMVGLNGHSLTEPIGTVDLAVLNLEPKVAAGARVTLTIKVRKLLTAASAPISPVRGFSGTIVVTSPGPAPSSLSEEPETRIVFDWRDLGFWKPLSPFGATVLHYDPRYYDRRWIAAPVVVHVIDPRVPRESPAEVRTAK